MIALNQYAQAEDILRPADAHAWSAAGLGVCCRRSEGCWTCYTVIDGTGAALDAVCALSAAQRFHAARPVVR